MGKSRRNQRSMGGRRSNGRQGLARKDRSNRRPLSAEFGALLGLGRTAEVEGRGAIGWGENGWTSDEELSRRRRVEQRRRLYWCDGRRVHCGTDRAWRIRRWSRSTSQDVLARGGVVGSTCQTLDRRCERSRVVVSDVQRDEGPRVRQGELQNKQSSTRPARQP